MEPILSVQGLQKIYGGKGNRTQALRGLDFKVFPGEFVGVMGPSGSGKTTLLNCISTIDSPSAGSILVEGAELTRLKGKSLSRFRRERLGFIFQEFFLMDSLTVLENAMLPLLIGKKADTAGKERARGFIRKFGIEGLEEKMPSELSGGERQRTAICRADDRPVRRDSKAQKDRIKSLIRRDSKA